MPGASTLATLALSLYLTHRQVYHALDAALGASPVLAFCVYNDAALLAAARYWLVQRPALLLLLLLLRTRLPASAPALGWQPLA